MANILVTGGTGTLGREVVARLIVRGHRVRVLTHHTAPTLPEGAAAAPGDLVTGAGLAAALDGIEIVMHLASQSQQALAIDVGGTRNLLAAAAAAGARPPHIVYISIVGVDRSSMSYYVAKNAAEALITASGLPWSILRATQFHGFIASLLQSLGVDSQSEVAVPMGVRVQSIDVVEVAERLVALAELGPLSHIAEMGGPEALDLATMATTYLRVRRPSQSVQVRAEPLQSPLFDAWRSGSILTPDHAIGMLTWEEYLTRAPAPTS